ncbi:helix-turn-helix domain-containing protein [Microvirga sp. 2YAF29]|uniref:helix-turn-helix domain-containing protein n=1 Tax=Microvirga sp. 2YAF29 TaxID=3233031 RepID=UPI003F96DC3B
MDNDRLVRSARVIAKALGVSERTVRRWNAKGIIQARKINGLTSPLTARKSDIDRLKRQFENSQE